MAKHGFSIFVVINLKQKLHWTSYLVEFDTMACFVFLFVAINHLQDLLGFLLFLFKSFIIIG